jgi:hypothetical protein
MGIGFDLGFYWLRPSRAYALGVLLLFHTPLHYGKVYEVFVILLPDQRALVLHPGRSSIRRTVGEMISTLE